MSVRTGTYQYKKMSKSTYAYVLNCVQSGTGQYRAVQGSTRNGTRQYRSKYNKVQGSTWRYMSVHGLHLRRAAGRGGGRFWCAFEIAALTAPTVASASSHCMHKLVYSSLGALARASPASATGSPFATRGQRRRRRLAMPRLAPRQPQPQPQVAASHPDSLPHRRPRPAGGRREGRRHVAAKRRLR